MAAPSHVLLPRVLATPLVEALTPTNEEWQRCVSVQDQLDLMKRRWIRMLREGCELGAITLDHSSTGRVA